MSKISRKRMTMIDLTERSKSPELTNENNTNLVKLKRRSVVETNYLLNDRMGEEKLKAAQMKKKHELKYLTVNSWIPPIITNKDIASQKNTISLFVRKSIEDTFRKKDRGKLICVESQNDEKNFTKEKLYAHKRRHYKEFQKKKGAIFIKEFWDLKHYKNIMKNAEISSKALEIEKLRRFGTNPTERRLIFDGVVKKLLNKNGPVITVIPTPGKQSPPKPIRSRSKRTLLNENSIIEKLTSPMSSRDFSSTRPQSHFPVNKSASKPVDLDFEKTLNQILKKCDSTLSNGTSIHRRVKSFHNVLPTNRSGNSKKCLSESLEEVLKESIRNVIIVKRAKKR